MKEYIGQIAVVTGAASGIGYGLAMKCISYGMKVVLADIDSSALDKMERTQDFPISKCIKVPTDVTKLSEVEALAQQTYANLGKVNFLFINAGVNIIANIWEYDVYDWKWIIDVNLWGTIHCLKAFLPYMRKQDCDSFVIITSSSGAFLPFQTSGPYNATKSAILALAETLFNELKLDGARISVHVLCPGMVQTNIDEAEVHRQKDYKNPTVDYGNEKRSKFYIPHEAVETGMSAEKVVDEVFRSIEKKEFYIFPQAEIKQMIAMKYEHIVKRNMAMDLSRGIGGDAR